jgi:uncharacterized protein (DUF2252 family)
MARSTRTGGTEKKQSEVTSPEQRAARLTQIRNLKMARSSHAYVRGNTVKFYDWLETSAGKVPEGPPVWICGDCHLGNLGPLADTKGRVAIQIRDLDQTVIGNPANDLIRLGLSLASAARGSNLPGVTTARILEQLVSGYERALSDDIERDKDKIYRPKKIQDLLERSVRRRWRQLALERLESVTPLLPMGKKFWALTPEERAGLVRLFEQEPVRAMITGLQGRGSSDAVTMVDAAYWIKGCSSLGRLRYAVMLRVGEGKGSAVCLVDLKEGVAAAAPRAEGVAMPRDNSVRVVMGAKALSPNLGDRMIAARFLDTGVVLRELLPQDLKIEVDRLTREEAMALAAYLAAVVGRAHGRQMDKATRDSWRSELAKARTSTLDAPSWLWSNVVELISIHEAAYLDHCRRFALVAGVNHKGRAFWGKSCHTNLRQGPPTINLPFIPAS